MEVVSPIQAVSSIKMAKNGTLSPNPNAEGEKPTPTPYLIDLTAPD
jgi:hypothetical protein